MALADQIKQAEAGQNVIKDSDLASGQLDKFNDFNSPVYKRAASLASRVSASRGLSNSSIGVGAAQGAILDKASDIAMVDSQSIINTGNNNANNRTQASVTNANNSTSIAAQLQSDKAAGERLGSQLESAEREGAASRASTERINFASIESNEGMAAAQRALDVSLSQMNIDATTAQQIRDISSREGMAAAEREIQRLGINTDATVRREAIAADERISAANLASAELRATLERENQLFMQKMGIEAETAMADLKNKYQVEAMNRESVGMAWNNLQQGIASIDPNASKESQTTMFNRLMQSFDSRMGFLGIVGTTNTTTNKPAVGTTGVFGSRRTSTTRYSSPKPPSSQ